MKKYISLRWLLLGIGIIAILGLTVMNVFSLYSLHQTTVESDIENKKLQINEFTDKVRYRFFEPFWGLRNLEIEPLEKAYKTKNAFPENFQKMLEKAADDTLFTSIYFFPEESATCIDAPWVLKFDPATRRFEPDRNFPEQACDGLGIAKTRMKVLIEEYLFNHKVIFDTHRSMTIALINLNEHQVFGYLTLIINQSYMIDEYLSPMLVDRFGDPKETGMLVWLRDWTKDRIVASNDPSRTYHRDKVQFRQRFPDFFDDWTLHVAFLENPAIAASRSSLVKNFVVLAIAFSFLLGALVFMFITAQRERALAQRQAGFLANVTHELKTPLAVMQAAGENLADGRVDDQQRLKSYGNHIYSESVRLKRMIEKLLDVAKTDAGQSMIEPKPFHLNELLSAYMERHRSYIENKGFTVRTDIPGQLPMVMIDEGSFETIVGNLIENAIKYSRDDKYLGIKLYRVNGKVVLEITDQGVGIPKKSIKQIFDKFYRVEDALTAQTKGHGLGLSIVKNLVELNGGNIDVKSEEGKGSVFTVTFPVLVESDRTETGQTGISSAKASKKKQDTPEYVG